MKWNKRLVLFSFFLAENTDDVLDILMVILHLAIVVAFDGEGHAKLDLVEIYLLAVVENILFEDLTNGGVVVVKELDHFNGGVNENDNQNTERYDSTKHGVDRCCALEVERRKRLPKDVK